MNIKKVLIFILIILLVFKLFDYIKTYRNKKNNKEFHKEFNEEFNNEYISVNTNEPLYEIYNNYIPKHISEQLYLYIKNHPKNNKNNLSYSFKGSYGLSFSFKNNNIYKNLKQYNLEQLYEIINKLIHNTTNDSNAYYFNILIIPTKKENKKMAANFHYDNTLSIEKNNKDILPKFVTVLYLHLPTKFNNGHLIIKNNNDDIKIKPEVSKLIKFRGDTYHGVENMSSNNNDFRVSLVLEHYKLSNDDLKQVPDFIIH